MMDMKTSAILKKPFFWVILITGLLLPFLQPFLKRIPEPPPLLGTVPLFVLTNQNGQSFGTEQLASHVYIASFIFTNCPSVCPLITKNMAQLQQRFQDIRLPIFLVSFTVDPTVDTPDILKKYGERFHADFNRWNFLTGSDDQMRTLLEKGFAVGMGEKIRGKSLYDIAHSQKLVLVDGLGRIRGYYSSDEEGLDEVFHRAQHVYFLSNKM